MNESWNQRYREGSYRPGTEPTHFLARCVDQLPAGRALDLATGTGRNALFLAEHGYDVDAIDVSGVALRTARKRASQRSLDVNWIQADLTAYPFPPATYDIITVVNYHTLDRLGEIKEALTEHGVLLYRHHLRSSDEVDRGPTGRWYRFGSNELLRSCLDLTVLHYSETTQRDEQGTTAVATLLARNSSGPAQSYPRFATDTE